MTLVNMHLIISEAFPLVWLGLIVFLCGPLLSSFLDKFGFSLGNANEFYEVGYNFIGGSLLKSKPLKTTATDFSCKGFQLELKPLSN